MGFAGSIRTEFGTYATFSRRAARPEFSRWVPFLVIVGFVINLIDGTSMLQPSPPGDNTYGPPPTA